MGAELRARHRGATPLGRGANAAGANTRADAPGSTRGQATLSLIGGVQGFIPVPDSHHRGGATAVVTRP